MDPLSSLYVLPAAFILDLILGDPRLLPHPVRWMGKAIASLESVFRRIPIKIAFSGAFFASFLVLTTGGLTFAVVKTAAFLHPGLEAVIETVLVYYCIAVGSLESSAMDVSDALGQNRLGEAKKRVGLIVGRDVEELTEAGIARAGVETVAENLVDGVISPLFYAALGGAPLAMAYKMVNTLDSMVGYKNERYRHFGKFAARVDDIANFIPARLAVPIISFAAQILANRGGWTYRTAKAEGANHSSPNAGYPEAAFAGALGVKIGGPNYYQGHLVSKPYIGSGFGDVKLNDIRKACDLMILASLLWVGILWGFTICWAYFQ